MTLFFAQLGFPAYSGRVERCCKSNCHQSSTAGTVSSDRPVTPTAAMARLTLIMWRSTKGWTQLTRLIVNHRKLWETVAMTGSQFLHFRTHRRFFPEAAAAALTVIVALLHPLALRQKCGP